jgi:hypothetical protein
MKSLGRITSNLSQFLLLVLSLALAPAALASNTWYVDGVNGNDNNDCQTAQTACQTIGHTISLCSSGDSIMVAPATYTENLTININLKIIGANTATTIVDGNQAGSVFTISNVNAHVTLSKLTIRNGNAKGCGPSHENCGGGIYNGGVLTINNSTISGNIASDAGGGIACSNYGAPRLIIKRSTITANSSGVGGGVAIFQCTAKIKNSTISGNSANDWGGGFYYFEATATINNVTVSGNSAPSGGGVAWGGWKGSVTLQNTIVARNSGGNCWNSNMTSNGYNLSSDDTCNFTGTGDMNNTKPGLGKLGNHGGPTQTMLLLEGSPAIDAGNPNGCTDGNGHLLKTDQRGYPRPAKYKQGKPCDIGAVERQKD